MPAGRHSNGYNLSFADGHAETRRLVEPSTFKIFGLPGWIVLRQGVNPGDRDISKIHTMLPDKVPL